MNYQTQMQPINIQILQSVLYNIEKDIPLIKITLEFDDEQKYKRFKSKIAPLSNDDQEVLSNSDSDDVDTINEQSNKQSNDLESTSVAQHKYVEKLSRLELSIILKQNYQDKIDEISKKTGVRILIVPEKLKFFGSSDDDIAVAKSLVHEIKTNITISTLKQYGKQASESNYIRQKLQKQGIKLGKIAEKYYYWYDESLCDEKLVEDVIEDVFLRNVHIFYPLVEDYERLKRLFNKKYIQALIHANVKLYEEYLESQLNEDVNNQHKIELNISKTEAIIHIKVLQQAQILKHSLKKFYSDLIQFYIHFKTDQNGQIQKIREIEQLLTEKEIMWSKHEDIILLSFNKNNNRYRANESISNLSLFIPTEARQKEFLESLQHIFQLNYNCYVEYLEPQGLSEEEIQQKIKPFNKKISIEYKKFDGLVVISPKSQRPKLLIDIIDKLILKPKLYPPKQAKAQKQGPIDKALTQSNQSNLIHDTTSRIQQTMTQMEMNEGDQSIIPGVFKKNNVEQFVLGQLKLNQLNEYKFYIKDQEGQKKYDDNVQQLKKGKGKFSSCQDIQNTLQQFTKRKFKPYLVILPEKYKVSLPQCDDMVTVFMRDSDKEYLKKDIVHVYLLSEEKKIISTNGWLLNISKSKIIHQNDYRLSATVGTFEIIFYVKYIDQA